MPSPPSLPPGQDLLDALPDGVVVADEHGVVVAANRAAARMLRVSGPTRAGSRARSGLVGARLEDAMALQDQDGCTWHAANRPYEGLPTRSGLPEQSWYLPDGTEVLVTGRLHRERRGAPVSNVALVLRSGRGRARLDRDRSDLVATIAHELRSPLTGVRGFVTTLLTKWDRLNDEQKKLMLQTVNTDSARLTRLIAELLDVARIDTGRLPLYPRPVDPVLIAERVIASIGASTSRPLTLDLPEPTGPTEPTEPVEPVEPLRVWADPDKLTQVLTNLVENAVRHGEGRIVLRLRRWVPEAPHAVATWVELAVADEGDGIPEDIRRRVFTKFWKHGVRGGSGLGMYLVNGLVRAHGGEVEITDAPGGGALILVRWPAEDPQDPASPADA